MPDYQVLDVISNRYELTDKLGEGGMGAVYEAIDRLTSEIVAIKRVRLNKALSEEVAHRTRLALTREFQTLATLRHPNIIGVLDYGFDAEQNPFFAMPLLKDAELFHKAAWERDDLGQVDLLLQQEANTTATDKPDDRGHAHVDIPTIHREGDIRRDNLWHNGVDDGL